MKATLSIIHPAPYRYEDTTEDYNLGSLFKSYLNEHYPDRISEFYPIIDQTDAYLKTVGVNAEYLESGYNSTQNYVVRVVITMPEEIPFNVEVQDLFVNWLKNPTIWTSPGDFSVTYEA